MEWIALLLVSLSAFAGPSPETVKHALESQPACANFVRFDDENLYLGFGSYRNGWEEPRHPIPATLRVSSLSRPAESFVLPLKDAAIDSVRDGNALFVLTYSGIEEWDLSSRQRAAVYPTYAYGKEMAYMEHPRAFARYGNTLIIAHGRLGLSFFDLKTRRITNQYRLLQEQLPAESMAMGVAVSGKYAYVVMDNFTMAPPGKKPAFRGVIVIDMESEQVIRELDGMDPGVDAAVADKGSLVASFGGMPVWKYNLGDLNTSTLPGPAAQIWRFPSQGHPVGKPAMDEKYYYTCFLRAPEKPGGSYKAVPVAFSRSELML
jgi:hypothetical protein